MVWSLVGLLQALLTQGLSTMLASVLLTSNLCSLPPASLPHSGSEFGEHKSRRAGEIL